MASNMPEYIEWQQFMYSRHGQWTVDPIHNGLAGRDLLCFAPRENDPTCGAYVRIGRDGAVDAGSFEGAIPHIGDAMFKTMWSCRYNDFEAAKARILTRLGM